MVSRIAAVTGITEEAGRPLLETLGDALRPRQLVLALDNCEHLLDACAQVGRHLLASAPGLRLLSTSREPLSVAAETIWRVPPLTVAPAGADTAVSADPDRYEAVRLFAERAAASRPGFTLGPARAGRAADRGGRRAAGDGGPAATARRAHGRLPGSGPAAARRCRRRPALGQRPGPDQRGRGRAGPGPAGARGRGRREPGADRGGQLPGGFGATELADPPGTPDRHPGGQRPQQQGHRGRALHQPDHRGQARG